MTEKSKSKILFDVFVDDNFHYQDESERYKHGAYETWEEAVATCKRIVDADLLHLYKAGESTTELYYSYTSFGEDPFIRPAPHGERFSAWEYAQQRCEEICANDSTVQGKMGPGGENA